MFKGMKKIKIFGERNTGTNYLRTLILLNLKVGIIEGGVPTKQGIMKIPSIFDLFYDLIYRQHLGWKHAVPDHKRLKRQCNLKETGFITLTKNPYAFLLSLHKRPYHYKGKIPSSFDDFLKRRWHTVRRENHNQPFFTNPVHLWNIKNKAYMELRKAFPEITLNLTYEQLVEEPEETVLALARYFHLEPLPGPFKNQETSTKEAEKNYRYYRNYYLAEEWRENLMDEDISFINLHLDPEVMDYFGYRIIK